MLKVQKKNIGQITGPTGSAVWISVISGRKITLISHIPKTDRKFNRDKAKRRFRKKIPETPSKAWGERWDLNPRPPRPQPGATTS